MYDIFTGVVIYTIDTCPRLTNPPDGRIVYQTRPSYVGNEVIYQCHRGNGSVELSRKCLSNGVWQSLPMECYSKYYI